jgi:hypothetical protein
MTCDTSYLHLDNKLASHTECENWGDERTARNPENSKETPATLGGIAQWQSPCLVCLRPGFLPHIIKRKEGRKKPTRETRKHTKINRHHAGCSGTHLYSQHWITGRLKQEDHEFKASLSYIIRPKQKSKQTSKAKQFWEWEKSLK